MTKIEKQNKFAQRQFVDTPRDREATQENRDSVKARIQKRREDAEKILNKQEFRRR